MATKNMIFPGSHSTANVETVFVSSYRLDICEVASNHFEFLYNENKHSKPMGRYFLEVEGKHIVSYKISEDYFNTTGECRWDFFCRSKSDVKKMVQEFEALIADCASLSAKITQKPAMESMIFPKLKYKSDRLLQRFGVRF